MTTGNVGQLTGERLGKEYRDRYANFSKNAHFVFGGQGKSHPRSFLLSLSRPPLQLLMVLSPV